MVKLEVTWRYCVALYCITMLYASLHELLHHFAAYLICGDWGYKSFNYFATACEGTRKSWYATYAGPLFSFAMMYVGAHYLATGRSPYRRHLGFALIFAQLPLQRMLMPFFRMNDEYIATVSLFGNTPLNFWLVILVVWGICIPPLHRAYVAIENRHRLWWFLFYLTLFPLLLFGPPFMILEYLMVERGALDRPFIGIGLLFILNEIVTIALFFWTKRWIDPEYRSAAAKPQPRTEPSPG